MWHTCSPPTHDSFHATSAWVVMRPCLAERRAAVYRSDSSFVEIWNSAMRLFHEELKARREALGFDANRVAQVLGLTPMSYFDLEMHSDEWQIVTPLYVVRFVCRWFELEFLDYVEATQGGRLYRPTPSHTIIRERRQAKGLSEEAFADACGFHPAFTSIIETIDGVALYPFEISRIVCRVLALEQKSFAQFSLLSIF
jgi:transcriptional regulator with XRE-family HTH domain